MPRDLGKYRKVEWGGHCTLQWIDSCVLKQKMPWKVLCCQPNIMSMSPGGFSQPVSLSADLAWCCQGVSRFAHCQCASVSSNTKTAL